MSSLPRILCPILLATAAAVCSCWGQSLSHVTDLRGHAADPLARHDALQVLLFARTDCPITKRYAPELKRISDEFAHEPVRFWMIFPDRSDNPADIRSTVEQYGFPGEVVLDPDHQLVELAHATVAPEAALFDRSGRCVYHGRIDDLYVDIGKARSKAEVHDLEDAITASLAGLPVKQAETAAVGCSLADVE